MELSSNECAFMTQTPTHHFKPHAEDILTDEDLLDLFRIIKQVLRKKPDAAKLANLLFCMSYALGDRIKFYKPLHEDHILFCDEASGARLSAVRVPTNNSCCNSVGFEELPALKERWLDSSSSSGSSVSSTLSPLSRLLGAPTTTHPSDLALSSLDAPSTDATVRPYTNYRPLYTSPPPVSTSLDLSRRYPPESTLPEPQGSKPTDPILEPHQRGFYYQDGRIAREPVSLQRYAEQGILTQASLMRKRSRHSVDDGTFPFDASAQSAPVKKPKIPHRHGEFEMRRDDIIARMRQITMSDLEQKAQRMPDYFSLVIEQAPALPANLSGVENAGELLKPSLTILAHHSNMKPHLDNGMNQNGIYYNADYFRLFLAFDQFQRHFATLFPNEVTKIPIDEAEQDEGDRDGKDRERNANMKAYRAWIEPLLSETNWAAFRRNIVVGERIMQLTRIVGQGVLLMTKELSGSKLHLTFTNNEWDVFISGLASGKWDTTIKSEEPLVDELRRKLNSSFWFHPDGRFITRSSNPDGVSPQ